MSWHLDVTFKEDANSTLDKMAAQSQNIIGKWFLSILIEIRGKKISLQRKCFGKHEFYEISEGTVGT